MPVESPQHAAKVNGKEIVNDHLPYAKECFYSLGTTRTLNVYTNTFPTSERVQTDSGQLAGVEQL